METIFILLMVFLGQIAAHDVYTSLSTTPGPRVVETKVNEQLLITAVPQDINQLNTEPLTINCTYQPPPSQSQFVVQSLVLTQSDGFVLSSLHVTNPDVPTTPDASLIRPGHVSIKGHLRSTGSLTSYLSVTWATPTEKEQGIYHCEAIIKDETFSTLHVSRETTVNDNTHLTIRNKIESLDKRLVQQEEDTLECKIRMDSNDKILANKCSVCSKKWDSLEAELEYQNQTTSSNTIEIESLQKELAKTNKNIFVYQDDIESLKKNLMNYTKVNVEKIDYITTEMETQKKIIRSFTKELENQRKTTSLCKEKMTSLETKFRLQQMINLNKSRSLERELELQKDFAIGLQNVINSLQVEITNLKNSSKLELENQKKLIMATEWRLTLINTNYANFHVSTVFKDRAYLLGKEITDGFSTAESACSSVGGYLAEIEDNEEWTFITGFLNEKKIDHTLIGGKDDIKEGSWYWSHSKRPVTFTEWSPGQPDDASHHEDCLEIWSNNFHGNGERVLYYNDVTCMHPNRYHFLCEVSHFNLIQ